MYFETEEQINDFARICKNMLNPINPSSGGYEPYEPYKLEYLPKLMQFFYTKGWYGGTLDLLTITMKGGFEAFTGRASETWEANDENETN